MKKRFLSLMCGVLVCFTMFAKGEMPMAAEQSAEPEELRLSLAEARDYAVKNNRTLQNADIEVRKAYAVRWQTIAQMLPQVDGKLDYQTMCGYEMNFGGMSVPLNPTGTLGITASIAINGQMIVGALLNNLAIDMQDISYRQSELDIVSGVETAYITVLAMQKTVDILSESLTNLENLYNITNSAVQAGAAEQTQADQIQVQVSSMKSTINATKRNVEVLYNSLALQLAAGPDVRLVLTDELDSILNVEDAVELLKSDFILENNYSYQLAQKNVQLGKRNITMAGMAYVPTLSMFYQYSAKTYFGKSEGMNMTPPNMVGVTLSVPLWSSGKRAAAITESKLALQAAENTLADAEDGLKVQHKQLCYDLSSAYEDFDIQKFNIEVSQRVFNSTSDKFEQGYASSLELTNASTTLLTAQSDYIQSILTLVNAQIELKKLLNKR